jgi:broad specificity phosphatase PhoE
MSTHLMLIRHAAVDTASRLCGSFDVPLSARGLAQVRAVVASRRARSAPHALYTSTLRRATQVAEALASLWRLVPMAAPWAREIHCGEVEGVRLADLERRCPRLWRRHEAQDDDTFAWPGGESYGDFRRRVMNGLSEVARAHPGARVSIVTHAGVVSQVLGAVRQRPPAIWSADRPEFFTATEVVWENDRPLEIISFNECDWY